MLYGTQVGEGWHIQPAPLRWVKTVLKKMPLTRVYQRETSKDEWELVDPSSLPSASNKKS